MPVDQNAVTLAVIGILATCVGGLLWIIKFMFTKLLPAIDGLTKATVSNTRAASASTRYLKKRNGRDGEMHKELIKAVGAIPEQIVATANVTAKQLKSEDKKRG